MNKNVKLIYASPLWLISNGCRYSHNNHHLSDSKDINNLGSKDFNLIKKVGFKYKHESILEHSLLVFHIECSRAVLQEISRHRLQSLTVKSTRYTLKELKDENFFVYSSGRIDDWQIKNASKYLVFTGDEVIDELSMNHLENLRYLLNLNKSNDVAKYVLPEAFKTSLQLSINLRSLLNLLELRTNKDALWEFREIAFQIIDELPNDYRELVLENEKIRRNYEKYKEKI